MSTDESYASSYHVPVLVREVLEWLEVADGKSFVDGTAGGGGHTEAILEASGPDGRVLAIDRDPDAVQQVKRGLGDFGERLTVRRANYAATRRVLNEERWEKVDGWLVDAGVSSHQLEQRDRGFSFQYDGPLDMRMGPEAQTVGELLDAAEVDELADVLRTYGEVKGSRRLAEAIVDARRQGTLETTRDLAELVENKRGKGPRRPGGIHPATLVFQALRIAVNRELEHLQRAVEQIPSVVQSGGRAVFISFHSLEDRIVKHGFRNLANSCVCPPDLPVCGCDAVSEGEVLTRGPVEASSEECRKNRRARSAKLRAFRVERCA